MTHDTEICEPTDADLAPFARQMYELLEILHTGSLFGNDEMHIDVNAATDHLLDQIPRNDLCPSIEEYPHRQGQTNVIKEQIADIAERAVQASINPYNQTDLTRKEKEMYELGARRAIDYLQMNLFPLIAIVDDGE